MAATIQTIVNEAASYMQDLSAAQGLILAQELHTELLDDLKMLADTEDITLTSAQTYALDEDVMKVWSGEYHYSADDVRQLRQTSLDYLNKYRKTWRQRPASDPREMYIDNSSSAGMLIGFTPAPGTATSGTYPFVRLYVARTQTLALVSTIPQAVQNHKVYVSGICMKWAQMRRPFAEFQRWVAIFNGDKQKLMKRAGNRLSEVSPTIDPYITQTASPR